MLVMRRLESMLAACFILSLEFTDERLIRRRETTRCSVPDNNFFILSGLPPPLHEVSHICVRAISCTSDQSAIV